MRNITTDELRRLWPEADHALIDGLIVAQNLYPEYGITKAIRLAHFWGQVSHESGAGTEMTESLNYSASALRSQWPKHFTPAQAERWGRTASHPANQRMIGDLAYGGRMGNAPFPSDDGYNFRGRGLIQTTGRSGYDHLARLTGLPLLDHPEKVNDPAHALHCALAEFASYHGILNDCDNDDIVAVTRKINGGLIGFDSRKVWLAKWKKVLGI